MHVPPGPPIISLTTDFGLSDTYVGVMKAVILGIAPSARLIDLTHAIAPQNIVEATVRLEAAAHYFPPRTIHLVVVDPGVGGERAACVVETEMGAFVAPDNGVLTLPLRGCGSVRAIRLGPGAEPFYRRPVSATFHGRDVFAPIAAHLALGLDPATLGSACARESLVTIELPEPQEFSYAPGEPGLRVPLLYTDRFGNMVTALTRPVLDAWLARHGWGSGAVFVHAGARRWRGISRTFADVPTGEPVAYWGSSERLEIAIRDGDASRALHTTDVRIVAPSEREE